MRCAHCKKFFLSNDKKVNSGRDLVHENCFEKISSLGAAKGSQPMKPRPPYLPPRPPSSSISTSASVPLGIPLEGKVSNGLPLPIKPHPLVPPRPAVPSISTSAPILPAPVPPTAINPQPQNTKPKFNNNIKPPSGSIDPAHPFLQDPRESLGICLKCKRSHSAKGELEVIFEGTPIYEHILKDGKNEVGLLSTRRLSIHSKYSFYHILVRETRVTNRIGGTELFLFYLICLKETLKEWKMYWIPSVDLTNFREAEFIKLIETTTTTTTSSPSQQINQTESPQRQHHHPVVPQQIPAKVSSTTATTTATTSNSRPFPSPPFPSPPPPLQRQLSENNTANKLVTEIQEKYAKLEEQLLIQQSNEIKLKQLHVDLENENKILKSQLISKQPSSEEEETREERELQLANEKILNLSKELAILQKENKNLMKQSIAMESILEFLKPHLKPLGITISSDMKIIGEPEIRQKILHRIKSLRLPKFACIISAGNEPKKQGILFPQSKFIDLFDESVYNDSKLMKEKLLAGGWNVCFKEFATDDDIANTAHDFGELVNDRYKVSDRCRLVWFHFSGHGMIRDRGKELFLIGRNRPIQGVCARYIIDGIMTTKCPAGLRRLGEKNQEKTTTSLSSSEYCMCVNIFVFDCCRSPTDQNPIEKLTSLPEHYGSAFIFGCANGGTSQSIHRRDDSIVVGHLTGSLEKNMKPGITLSELTKRALENSAQQLDQIDQEMVIVSRDAGPSNVLDTVIMESKKLIKHQEKLLNEIDKLPSGWMEHIKSIANRWIGIANLENMQDRVTKFFRGYLLDQTK